MPRLRDKLRSRLLSTDFDNWNHPWRAKLMAPVFVVFGGVIGIIVHYHTPVDNPPLPVFWLGTLLLGYVVLATVD